MKALFFKVVETVVLLLEIVEVVAVEVVTEGEDGTAADAEEIVAGARDVAAEVDKDDVLSTAVEVVAGVMVVGADLELVANVMVFVDNDELVVMSTIDVAVVLEKADDESDAEVDVEMLILLATKSAQKFNIETEAALLRHSDHVPILALPLKIRLIRTEALGTEIAKVIRRRVIDGSLIEIIRIATDARLNTSLDEDLLPFQRYVPSVSISYTLLTHQHDNISRLPTSGYSRSAVAQRTRRFAYPDFGPKSHQGCWSQV